MQEASFIVSKKSIEEAMKLLDAIPTRNGITSSEFIKAEIQNSKYLVLSLSSEISGYAKIPVAKSPAFKKVLYLDRRMLKPFVAAGLELASSDTYEFYVEEALVKVKHGTRIAKLESNNSSSGYEARPDLKGAISIELKDAWTSIANCATLCACSDPIMPALNCIHVSSSEDRVYMRASDTKLVFQGTLPAKAFPCKESISLPLELVDNLKLFSSGMCHYTPKWAALQFPIGFMWQAVKTECRKNFPSKSIADVVSGILKEGSVVSIIGTQSLVEAADRIAGYMQSAMRDSPVLTLTITAGKKRGVLSSNTIGAAFNETITLDKPAEKDFVVAWNLSAVLPVMQYCKNVGSAKIIRNEKGDICLKAGKVVLVTAKELSKKKKGK